MLIPAGPPLRNVGYRVQQPDPALHLGIVGYHQLLRPHVRRLGGVGRRQCRSHRSRDRVALPTGAPTGVFLIRRSAEEEQLQGLTPAERVHGRARIQYHLSRLSRCQAAQLSHALADDHRGILEKVRGVVLDGTLDQSVLHAQLGCDAACR